MAQLEHIEAIEKRLWRAADTLRANSNYASNEYFMPVMGLIFLRHAYSRYLAVKDEIEANLPKRGGKTREVTKEDFSQKSAIFLQPRAQFDYLVSLTDADDRAKAIVEAMESIEADYTSLADVLPKAEYQEVDNTVLGQLLRTLNRDELKKASGDIFGRIYEYFLTEFANLKAHDNGEFFTPISLVSLIANVLEPSRGTVFDPACGSGGMFVQSAHFVERLQQNPNEKLTFRGLEKNATTIRLAKMNLAVHGLEGDIKKAITYYDDPHELLRKADFVMANPPFNVDEVDADKVKTDPRLPFGLPGVNKAGKVQNGNYLWISYFYSYLNEKGRAGFVMSSQASSAGRDEARVRQKLVETGDVDIMIAIRSNFFYTRTVPCELWFIDRGKPDQPSPLAPLPAGEGGGEKRERHYRGGFDFSGLVERARELRKKQTTAESLLWELLRDRRFVGLKFCRQHQFGDYILDFYCDEHRLAIELDGGVHEGRRKHDAKRDAYLASQGVTVIRIPNRDLLNDPEGTLRTISARLPDSPREASAESQAPLPLGEGQAGDRAPLPLGEGRGEGRYSVSLNRKGHVLMIDARNIYRKVTRKIYDFSPEQLQNILAIVWLYRGQAERFLELVAGYCARMLDKAEGCFCRRDADGKETRPLLEYADAFQALRSAMQPFLDTQGGDGPHAEVLKQLEDSTATFSSDLEAFKAAVEKQQKLWADQQRTNGALKAAVDRLATMGETSRDLVKQADLLYKLVCRLIEVCENECGARESDTWSSREIARARKAADTARQIAVEQLKQVRYFWKQAHWLVERFPEAKLRDVEGLVKLVSAEDIKANDWSLTPGRYVGVAPEEEDGDFDFEEALRDIHLELEGFTAVPTLVEQI
ncbi:MAG TPA: N-6 DNA methylase [Sedimentisphaerales bacterium]|nr:N-6 DNA methylase [Sedimentisphaerales bacterium]